MSKHEDILHSILIVSGSEKYSSLIKDSLPAGRFLSIENKKNGTLARQCILERFYDMVVINAPLSDENGLELAMDIAEEGSVGVMIMAPAEVHDDIQDYVARFGIFTVPKPTDKKTLGRTLKLFVGVADRISRMRMETEKLRDRIEANRIITKAKFILADEKNMSEDEAHRYIGKCAMDRGVSRRRIAEDIIEEFD